jgi:hypothetical protein
LGPISCSLSFVRAGAKEIGIREKNKAKRLTRTGVAGSFLRNAGLVASLKLIRSL